MFRQLIHRPIAVVMVLIAVIVLGLSAVNMLPVSLVPDIDIPQITVRVSSPNMSARELNESVVAPLRQQLVQVSGLSDITTETKDGNGLITMVFDYDTDADYLFVEVNEKIDRSMNSLPEGTERPKVIKASATDIPAFYINITVSGEDDFKPVDNIYNVSPKFVEMSNFATQVIVRRIEQLSDVAMVDESGTVSPEILVIPDSDKLKALGITEQELETAIQGADVRLGNLTIRDGEYQYNVRFESGILGKSDIEDVYIKLNGRVYQVKELAEVHEHSRQRGGMVLSDNKPAVTLAVIKRSEAKMADLKESMNELLDSFVTDYPTMEFTVTRDQTELLEYSIHNMIKNIIWGAVFACLIIFFFMRDFRSPLLVVVTIPTALIVSFLLFYAIGITINIISLSGLVLGLGMMVDNSIITIDNITRLWNSGKKLEEACVSGAREVFMPMLSSVLTTCAVFLPLIFLSGISGALFYDQAMAVTITLFSALAVSVVVIPVFYYMFYKKQSGFTPNKFISRMGIGDMTCGYDKILKWFFRRRWIMWSALVVAILGTGVLFAVVDKEKLPELSHNDSLLSISWNERIPAEENSKRCGELVGYLSDYLEQSTIMAGVQQFMLSHTEETSISEAIIYVKTASTKDIEQVEERAGKYIRERYPNAVFEAKPSGNLFDMIFSEKESILAVRIRSTDGSAPDPVALNELLAEIKLSLPQVDIQPVEWQEHIELVARPEMLALYGVSYQVLLSELKKSLNDNPVLTITQGANSVPVIIGSNKSEIKELLDNHDVRVDGVDISMEALLGETRNRDLKSITSGPEGEYYHLGLELNNREVPGAISAVTGVVQNDPRFEVSFSGSYFSNREMIKELCLVLMISILLLFFILAAQFESLIQPLIIMFELIADIFGAILVLWILGESINLMSLIGIVVMCGIVINDSILKVDTINRLRSEGLSLKHAIFEAGGRRLKAIIMTSLTTILAIAPFLVRGNMGSDLQYPLSLALISGMVVGTFVSVFFLPLAYYEIYKGGTGKGRK